MWLLTGAACPHPHTHAHTHAIPAETCLPRPVGLGLRSAGVGCAPLGPRVPAPGSHSGSPFVPGNANSLPPVVCSFISFTF